LPILRDADLAALTRTGGDIPWAGTLNLRTSRPDWMANADDLRL